MPASDVQIESVGVNAIDARRVDVAVKGAAELRCVHAENAHRVKTRGPRRTGRERGDGALAVTSGDAQPGAHILHVGVFLDDDLVARAARRFAFPTAEGESGA